MDYLLGIDLGSTSLKAVIYDTQGQMVAFGNCPTEKCHPSQEHPEWAVWQPGQIWGGAAAAVRQAVAGIDDPRKVRGVAVTGMGMDGLPMDADGRWLYPMISWHDPRTAVQFDWWKRNVGLDKTFAIAGNPVWPINSALRMLWVAQNEPAVFAQTHKWLLIEDFVNFMLCGRQATDYSMASCTLLFDQRRLDWSDDLLALSGLPRRILCEALPSGTPLGEIHAQAAKETGLPEGTPVILGGHDHLCGALPVGAFRPGVVLNVTGTWEMVMTATAQPVLDAQLPQKGMTVQAHVARGLHTIWGGNVAGDMVEWFRRQLGAAVGGGSAAGCDDWSALVAAAAASPPGARRVMFLPHMSAASCPMVDERSLGAFVGLGNQVTAGDLLRAVFEGLGYQMHDMVAAMEGILVNCGLMDAQRLARIVVVGGATRNAFWMQNKADIMGRPIEVATIDEATPLGAAILAGIGLGIYRDEQDAFDRIHRPGKIYQPDPERARRYADGFQVYRQLYPALAPISRQLG